MSDARPDATSPKPSPDELGRLDAAYDRFEAAWREGRRPRIEDELGEIPGPERTERIRELLVLELAYRRRSGERPAVNEYQRRFPDEGALVIAAFDVVMPVPPRPAVDADRNLLFGILAMQMEFITRDALVAAMNAWILEKQTPLDQILLRQGAMTGA